MIRSEDAEALFDVFEDIRLPLPVTLTGVLARLRLDAQYIETLVANRHRADDALIAARRRYVVVNCIESG